MKETDLEKLSTTGEEGLLRKMVESGGEFMSAHQMTRRFGMSGSKAIEYLARLKEQGLVEEEEMALHNKVYRPDPIAFEYAFSGRRLRDILVFARHLRTRNRVTCTNCGHSFKPILARMSFVLASLPCQRCGQRTRIVEYVPFFD